MTNNGRPLSNRKKVQLLLILTLMAWATQTLLHQWGYGAETAPPDASAAPAAPDTLGQMKFVPGASHYGVGATLEMRAEATVVGSDVKLKQVCRWSESDSRIFAPVADLALVHLGPRGPFQSLTVDEIRQTLRGAGVNVAVINFSGPAVCTVNRSDVELDHKESLEQWIAAREAKPAAAAAAAAGPSTRPVAALPAEPPAASTLRDIITNDLSVRLHVPVDQLQINFNPADSKVLSLSEPLFKFNLEARRARNLGDVAWDVLIVTETGTQKASIAATARAWQSQAVVSRPLRARQVIQPDDLTERRTLVDQLPDQPLLTAAQAAGQQSARDLQPGVVLTASCVEAVPLVKVGQLVTVTAAQGAVRIKTVAAALEAGSFGQAVKVRNDVTRDVYEVVVTGPQEATLGLSESGPAVAAR